MPTAASPSISIVPTATIPIAENDPEAQKNKLLTALDGFGFSAPKKQPSEVKIVPAAQENPYFIVTVKLFISK
jgi:hypothetical protein